MIETSTVWVTVRFNHCRGTGSLRDLYAAYRIDQEALTQGVADLLLAREATSA